MQIDIGAHEGRCAGIARKSGGAGFAREAGGKSGLKDFREIRES